MIIALQYFDKLALFYASAQLIECRTRNQEVRRFEYYRRHDGMSLSKTLIPHDCLELVQHREKMLT